MTALGGASTLDPLIGRTDELAAIDAALRASRLVTITGLGGTGKTRVALAVGDAWAAAGPTAFVDLSRVAHARDVPSAIATTLGVSDVGTGSLDSAIAQALTHDAGYLLVLDNFEHVLGAGTLVAAMMDRSPTARLLVTSRIRLGLAGERTIALRPLNPPVSAADIEAADASRLFLRRARERGGLTGPAAEESDAIVTICQRLDGLPLALELAAAWTRLLSPRAIVRRLEAGRLRLGPGDAGRHESLERIVDSTLELVGPGDRAAFEALAVFLAGCDEIGARAVTGIDEVLLVLRRLEDVALVRASIQADGEPRFAMLETIRSVAAERLDRRPDAIAVRRRFIEVSAARAQSAADDLRDLDPRPALAWMAAESPNLRAAYDAAVAEDDAAIAVQLAMTLATYGVRAGSARESLERLRAAMALGPVPAGIRSEALCAELNLGLMTGEPVDVLALGREAVALARAAGDVRREVRALVALASNDPSPEAIPALREAAELASRAGYSWGAWVANDNLAARYAQDGRWKDALELGRQQLAGRRDTEDGIGYVLASVAELLAFLGRPKEGLPFAERATVALGASWPVSHSMAWALTVRATCETLSGRTGDGCRTLAEACSVAVASESRMAAQDVLDGAVTVLAEVRPDMAVQAAACVTVLASGDSAGAMNGPLRPASATAAERRLGARRAAAEQRAGQGADPWALLTIIAATAMEAHASRTSLRAAYGALTAREAEVLRCLARGSTDREIGAELGMSPKTASVHVTRIKDKLGAATRIEAAVRAQALLGAAER